jgi:hypothetical protein
MEWDPGWNGILDAWARNSHARHMAEVGGRLCAQNREAAGLVGATPAAGGPRELPSNLTETRCSHAPSTWLLSFASLGSAHGEDVKTLGITTFARGVSAACMLVVPCSAGLSHCATHFPKRSTPWWLLDPGLASHPFRA